MRIALGFICIVMLFSFAAPTLNAQEQMLGEIKMFAGNFAPRGWAFCDGQLLPINQNTALFSLLGTTYGGDGRTTFGLPDLRGRFPMHAGNGPGLTPRRQGQKGGTETNTLTVLNLPNHNHALQAGKMGAGKAKILVTGKPTATVQTSTTGGSQAVNNMPPYQTVRFIIALQGYYPSRS